MGVRPSVIIAADDGSAEHLQIKVKWGNTALYRAWNDDEIKVLLD